MFYFALRVYNLYSMLSIQCNLSFVCVLEFFFNWGKKSVNAHTHDIFSSGLQMRCYGEERQLI